LTPYRAIHGVFFSARTSFVGRRTVATAICYQIRYSNIKNNLTNYETAQQLT